MAVAPSSSASYWQRALRVFRPSHRHTAFTATLLLMLSAFLSRIIGLVRTKYIAYLFGAGPQTDAFNSAFQLPDMIAYFLVGGAASVTFVTMLSRYRDSGRDEDGTRAMSVILTSMLLVLGGAIVLAEIFAPWYVRWWFNGFSPDQAALCTNMTRILLPGQLLFFAGGVFGSVMLVRKQFALQAVTPLVYNLGIIFGGVVLAKIVGIRSLAWGALAGVFVGPFLMNAIGAHRVGVRYRPMLDWRNEGLREWVRLSIPLMLGVSLVSFDSWISGTTFASGDRGAITLLTYAKSLFTARSVALGQAAGAASLPFLASLFSKNDPGAFSRNVNSSVSRILAFSILLTAWMIGLAFPVVDLIFRGGLFHRNSAQQMALYFAIFLRLALLLVGSDPLRARLLCRRQHRRADGSGHHRRTHLAPNLLVALPRQRSGRTSNRLRPRHRHPDHHPRPHASPPQNGRAFRSRIQGTGKVHPRRPHGFRSDLSRVPGHATRRRAMERPVASACRHDRVACRIGICTQDHRFQSAQSTALALRD